MFCPRCGAQIADEAIFCSQCGFAVPTAGEPTAGEPSAAALVVSAVPADYAGAQVPNVTYVQPAAYAQPPAYAQPIGQAAPALYPQNTMPSGAAGYLQPVSGYAIAAGSLAVVYALLRLLNYMQTPMMYIQNGMDMQAILQYLAATALTGIVPILLVIALASCLFVRQRKAVGVVAILYALSVLISWVGGIANVGRFLELDLFYPVYTQAISPAFSIAEYVLITFMAFVALDRERRAMRFVPCILAALGFVVSICVYFAVYGLKSPETAISYLVSAGPVGLANILLMLFIGLWLCPVAKAAPSVVAAPAVQNAVYVQPAVSSEQLLAQYDRMQAGEITPEEFQQYRDRFMAG